MALPIDDLLRDLVEKDASDLHLKAGQAPCMRIRGNLVRLDIPAIPIEEHNNRLFSILNEERRHRLENYFQWLKQGFHANSGDGRCCL